MLRVGSLEDAKAQVDEALALEPDSQDALYLAGRIARFAKDYPLAQKYLERSYLESPGAGAVANELALTLVEIGEEERKRALQMAEATYRQLRDAETASTLGWVCYRMGRMEDAEKVFNAVASASQLSPDAIYFFATFADDRGRGELVKPMLDIALKSDSQFAYRAEAQKLADRLSKKPGARRRPGPLRTKADATDTPPAKADGEKATAAKGEGAKSASKAAGTKPAAKADAPGGQSLDRSRLESRQPPVVSQPGRGQGYSM